ncbi:hypothetical protein [Polaribacter uvawellassae]|uniref:hypothetical protein n=1 Tax=Polaribacter uvawellassae TaxID=3133495 RepID=UPI00321A8688
MEKNTIPKKLIEPIFLLDNSIEKHLDNLHELMIYWLTYDNLYREDKVVASISDTYTSLREILTNLKPIEKEHDLYWDKKRSNTLIKEVSENIKEVDYKKKYDEALAKIRELKETNARLKSMLN